MKAGQQSRTAGKRASDIALLLCAVWLILLGLYFAILRPPLLPEDIRFIGPEAEAIARRAPGLLIWLRRIFLVMGGFMAATGLLVIHALRQRSDRYDISRSLLLLAAGAAGVGLMSVVNFMIASEFRWLLLWPPLAWVVALWLRRF